MRKTFAIAVVLALLCLGIAAQADINMETVVVGDPWNAGELSGIGWMYYPDRICGAVNYTYNIGKYEVTAAQYTDFLNHTARSDYYGLYNSRMADSTNTSPDWNAGCNIQRSGSQGSFTYSVASDWANRPVNYVSYWDSLRFANWLNNGQGNGDTETGAYTLNGYNDFDGSNIQRNAGAKWFLTSEDEWYKAAYYKGGGYNAGYWDYSTQSDTGPSNVGSDDYTDPGNHANFGIHDGFYTIGSPYYRTKVGEFENSESAYGTFDQGGNVWEWNETIVYQWYSPNYPVDIFSPRGVRGGSFYDSSTFTGGCGVLDLRADQRFSSESPYEYSYLGFRVTAVPEPSGLLALASGLLGLGGVCWRRKR